MRIAEHVKGCMSWACSLAVRSVPASFETDCHVIAN
jgi:hypothetical protein